MIAQVVLLSLPGQVPQDHAGCVLCRAHALREGRRAPLNATFGAQVANIATAFLSWGVVWFAPRVELADLM